MKQRHIFKLNSKFDGIAQEYLDVISNTLRQSTVKIYKNSLKIFFNFIITNYPELDRLSELSRSPHIEGWLSHIAIGRKKGTIKGQICCVRRFLEDIYEWNWKDAPTPGLITYKDLPPTDKYLPRPLTPEDDSRLQETLKASNTLLYQALFLMRKTGLRCGELLNLERNCLEEVSRGQYALHVPVGKTHSERIVPVDEETVEIVKHLTYLSGDYLPLPNPETGNPTQFLVVRDTWKRPSYSGLRNALITATRISGIQNHVKPHMLRHTYATELLRAGISLPALMKLLGHSNIAMTLRYAGVSQEDLRREYFKAMEKINSIDLLFEQQDKGKKDGKENILDGIDDIITRLHSFRKDSPEGRKKKKIQRIAERLRRAYQDIEHTFKGS